MLGACLWSVLTQVHVPSLFVSVVANGCGDATADVARAYSSLAEHRGHRLSVTPVTARGKAGALNAARVPDASSAQVFLDADTILGPRALCALVEALDTPLPRLAGVPPVIAPSPNPRVRSYFNVWGQLPAIEGKVFGGGIYAVNPAGRARWGQFPEIIADDAFVRSRFAREEQVVVEDDAFVLVPPEDSAHLPSLLKRWRAGNEQVRALGTRSSVTASRFEAVTTIARRPELWPHVPSFVLSQVHARREAGPEPHAAWNRSERAAAVDARLGSPRVHAVVVTHNNRSSVSQLLRTLASATPGVLTSVCVVDNASADGTADVVRDAFREVDVVDARANLGFARAANLGAARRPAGARFLLFLNPDMHLSPGSVSALVAVALRFPAGRVYGGCARRPGGEVDPGSCLAGPSLRQAITYALGVHRLPVFARFDPDALGGWGRNTMRHVPVLTGALLLVVAEHWEQLGGFDEQFFLYGEDVDLCLRSRAADGNPLFSPLTQYTHVGGGSSTAGERQERILQAKATIYRRHLPPWRARAAVEALKAGTALRALVEPPVTSRRWASIWRRRRQWSRGWTGSSSVVAR